MGTKNSRKIPRILHFCETLLLGDPTNLPQQCLLTLSICQTVYALARNSAPIRLGTDSRFARSRLVSIGVGVVRNRLESFEVGVIQSRPESVRVGRSWSHPESAGVGVVRSGPKWAFETKA